MGFGTPWKKMDDAALMTALAAGKERAFRELVERHQTGLYSFALRFCGVKEESEDAVQETFLRLFRNRSRFDTSGSMKAYLYKVCRNLLIDAARKRRPEPLDDSLEIAPGPSAYDSLSHKEGLNSLSRALDSLPENQRTAMVLRHTEELAYAEISEVMGLSLSAVESLLVRGRRTLRKRMQATAA
ncbi:RNA polymerase sigma factor [Desulfoluna limicola]|uniref:RNA polymerase sigma factor n=1 Tax=Desulfoluna limicola TaxID=2810562 RepID=A0ABM7PB46_9BACT|nr:sigma-70 family RNA polymerase sigma factor [Desulfoluna limicola]BCS94411.1 RNA polymerase sigma factor [Desulfoluna limicola]